MDNRASAWSVTINNPTPQDYEEVDLARQKGWKVEGQLEKGETGTYHLQLMVRTPQVRFSAVKKTFSRAHIEPARNPVALANYVTKAETRVGQLPTGSDKYPSLSKFWQLIGQELNHGHPTWTDDDKEAFHHPDLMHPDDGYPRNKAFLFSKDADRLMWNDPLKYLDSATEELIGRGYYVEHHASNPAVRSSFKKWWRSILYRAMETVRQTDSVQMVGIPSPDVEYNQLDADDSARSQATPGVLEGLDDQTEVEGNQGSEESRTSRSEGSSDDC